MSVNITPDMLQDWLDNTRLDTKSRSLLEAETLLNDPEYREFALKLIQKFIGKARHELSRNESPFPPKELEFQIDCKIDFPSEKRVAVILGCCGAEGGPGCLPCFSFEVGTTAQIPD